MQILSARERETDAHPTLSNMPAGCKTTFDENIGSGVEPAPLQTQLRVGGIRPPKPPNCWIEGIRKVGLKASEKNLDVGGWSLAWLENITVEKDLG